MSLVRQSAETNDAKKVIRITIAVGRLSGVVPESLAYCFNTIKEGSVAHDAELVIREIPATANCTDCGANLEVGPYDFTCPECGGIIIPSGGRELYLEELEVE